MKRMQDEDVNALLAIRQGLIEAHNQYLDAPEAPHSAIVRQVDVAAFVGAAIRQLEEVLGTAGGIS